MSDKPTRRNHGEWTAVTLQTFEQPAGKVSACKVFHLQRILVPVDFSPASREAFEGALRLGELFGAHMILLHVEPPGEAAACKRHGSPPSSCPEEREEEKFRLLMAMAQERLDRPIEWIVRIGMPSFEIVEAAKEVDADLIVIATHGHTAWKHFCIGSTAEHVARAASCAVFVVREKEHEFC